MICVLFICLYERTNDRGELVSDQVRAKKDGRAHNSWISTYMIAFCRTADRTLHDSTATGLDEQQISFFLKKKIVRQQIRTCHGAARGGYAKKKESHSL